MPTGAVYQPTTVTYEQPAESRWNCPVSYFSRRLTNSMDRVVCLLLGLGVFGLVLFIAGIPMVVCGSETDTETDGGGGGVGLLAAGGVLMVVGLLLAGAAAWLVVRRRGWSGGKEAGGGGGGAAAMSALNPSTDPLVAGQYAPVRDAPPAPDDETRNLMDNKECLSSAEESDKMLDGRPSVA